MAVRSVPYSHLRCTAQINGIINSDVSKSYPEFMRSGTRNAGRATDSDPARGLFPSVNELPHREAGDVECSPTNRPTVSADRPEICPTVHAPVPPSRLRTGCETRILATDKDGFDGTEAVHRNSFRYSFKRRYGAYFNGRSISLDERTTGRIWLKRSKLDRP